MSPQESTLSIPQAPRLWKALLFEKPLLSKKIYGVSNGIASSEHGSTMMQTISSIPMGVLHNTPQALRFCDPCTNRYVLPLHSEWP